ncbi:Endoplasmic reticulum membrane protein 65 [Neolecta irregularis DAH-3]|uniref:Endoplasmic reticulum membrane protein 65 n=1 Tax=Neolecta irregularis (strain DAH-3) TaxID=1198029 RepID=A0A1U7LGH9_NEOID|nr:Endoplasmic reticulum membrane protein 65 [Neolecta irregularis DAH-3]|eukprot:OLL21652.1 Endoplasmic reticulum membrane protein 65 [Neolecta irregularis DAH-3]
MPPHPTVRRNSFPKSSSDDPASSKPSSQKRQMFSFPAAKTASPSNLWTYLLQELSSPSLQTSQEIKRERVKNFISVPEKLETVIFFGCIICLDSFLYVFTILPLRFVKALWRGLRLYPLGKILDSEKCDVLKGFLVALSCFALSFMDVSRTYHLIRRQNTMKLYVLFNVLEISDRLLCAIGQDILDCLFSSSSFGRKKDGGRRHLRPITFFLLGVIYNVTHAIILFYQLVTLNVAVNSYSNALLTLLMSNQIVEIKSSVFKKFEKENLFQITCADIVERFQLSVLLTIISLRNLIELRGSSFSVLPDSYLPSFHVLITIFTPVLVVLSSEIIVDSLKHAFITKFNHFRPGIYPLFLDCLARDYIVCENGSQKFVDQSPAVSRRIGLPVLPLSCLFIRAMIQIYNMILSSSLNDAATTPTEDILRVTETSSGVDEIFRNFVDEPRVQRIVGLSLFSIMVFVSLVVLKLVLGVSITLFAARRVQNMKVEESSLKFGRFSLQVELDKETKDYINSDKEVPPKLPTDRSLFNIERYEMFSKRIY